MFERQDWELFRTLDGLSAKAGVPRGKIASLVVKELMDNALDASESCDLGLLDDPAGFFVQDHGPGLDPTKVADLFSIRKPLKSTKLLRLPSRGALGNGLMVGHDADTYGTSTGPLIAAAHSSLPFGMVDGLKAPKILSDDLRIMDRARGKI